MNVLKYSHWHTEKMMRLPVCLQQSGDVVGATSRTIMFYFIRNHHIEHNDVSLVHPLGMMKFTALVVVPHVLSRPAVGVCTRKKKPLCISSCTSSKLTSRSSEMLVDSCQQAAVGNCLLPESCDLLSLVRRTDAGATARWLESGFT